MGLGNLDQQGARKAQHSDGSDNRGVSTGVLRPKVWYRFGSAIHDRKDVPILKGLSLMTEMDG